MNRLPPEPDDEKQERLQEEIQRRISAIRDSAALLYDLLEPGMTVVVKLEEMQALYVPGQTPKVKRLYITRPMCALEVDG